MTPSTPRLLANTASRLSSLSVALSRRPNPQPVRAFSRTCARRQDDEQPPPARPSLISRLSAAAPPNRGGPSGNAGERSNMAELQQVLATNTLSQAMGPNSGGGDSILGDVASLGLGADASAHQMHRQALQAQWAEPYHFHVFTHKHNTHITVTHPNRDAIISMSTGNIGFKKAKRGSYDAAYQLASYVLDKLNQGGWHRKMTSIEVVLRGFGQGREAVTKALLGNEGRVLRPMITRVSDSTRLKFGGTRSPRPRRLG